MKPYFILPVVCLLLLPSPSTGDLYRDLVFVLSGLSIPDPIQDAVPRTQRRIVLSCSLEDLLRQKRAAESLLRIAHHPWSLSMTLPFQVRSIRNQSAFSVGLSGFAFQFNDGDKAYHTSLRSADQSWDVAHTLSIRSNTLHLSFGSASTENDDVFRVDRFPHSEDRTFNWFFYDLLPEAIGDSIAYTSSHRTFSFAVEDVWTLNARNRLSVRWASSDVSSDLRFVYQNTINDPIVRGEKIVEGETKAKARTAGIGYGYNVSTKLNLSFELKRFSRALTFDLNPRDPKKKGDITVEVTHLGDGKAEISGVALQMDGMYRFSDGSSATSFSLALSRENHSGTAYLSTPVLGKNWRSFFVPIVHRVNAEAEGDAFFQLYGGRFRRSFGRKLDVRTGLTFLYGTAHFNIKTRPNFYGIVGRSLNEKVTYRGFKLLVGDLSLKYRIHRAVMLKVRVRQYVPFKPQKEIAGKIKPPKPRPPRLRRESSGGRVYGCSLEYTF